jgi:hypothetical protein
MMVMRSRFPRFRKSCHLGCEFIEDSFSGKRGRGWDCRAPKCSRADSYCDGDGDDTPRAATVEIGGVYRVLVGVVVVVGGSAVDRVCL